MGVFYDLGRPVVGGWMGGGWLLHDPVRKLDLLWGGEFGQEGAVLFAIDVDSGQTVEELRTGLVGKIGENITPRRFELMVAKGTLYSYIHGAKVGVGLDLEGGNDELGQDIAMHIAAAKPKAIDQSGVDPELIDTERRVAIEKAKEAGKPEEMLEKIATGTVNKFLKVITLLNQAFVKDDKVSINELLSKNNATLHAFSMYSVGEGIEKKQEDFAAEVAAASKV